MKTRYNQPQSLQTFMKLNYPVKFELIAMYVLCEMASTQEVRLQDLADRYNLRLTQQLKQAAGLIRRAGTLMMKVMSKELSEVTESLGCTADAYLQLVRTIMDRSAGNRDIDLIYQSIKKRTSKHGIDIEATEKDAFAK